ncbi:hypothetical protein [Paenibacillus pabuli]|uniref:hypothetical protein n=1 Tax=Paenibacillus pabuli TaxID=1472 RepID=UPI001FFEF5C3|nr:hypothetical protein [Paenibacillus pabuli]UPK44790.1 hypothetical protein KET34_04515 [Paenibacillus pabuli]
MGQLTFSFVEFTIDVDKKGYITQFEHTFALERYLDLVRTQSYKVIKTNWKARSFHVMTYGYMEEVCNPNNVIFKCNHADDVFVVAELVPYSVGGVVEQPHHRYLHLRALISARDDLYPIDYMCEPNFDLSYRTITPTSFEYSKEHKAFLTYFGSPVLFLNIGSVYHKN